MQRTKSLGLHMKVGNDVNITAVNAEKNMETWKGRQKQCPGSDWIFTLLLLSLLRCSEIELS